MLSGMSKSYELSAKCSAGVEEAVAFGEFYGGAEEVGENRGGEKVAFGPVGGDAAVAHEEEAVDLGEDVGGVVGDEEDGSSLLGQLPE